MLTLSLLYITASFGFRVLREVTEDTTSTGDRLVWGAIGTLMELDIKSFFTEWTPKLTELSELAKATRIRNTEAASKAR